MKISVVTVCFNAEATIGATIRSFLDQTYPDKELLIVDGLSRDRTVETARAFASPQIRLVSEKDRGIYDAMNKGLRLFAGDAVGFLNADDTFHDNQALSRIAGALETAEAAYGDLRMVRDHDTKQLVRSWRAGTYSRGAFRKGWMPPHPTFYIRRALARRTGPFDLDYRISADYDFMLRALEVQGATARYIPHALVDFMVGGLSTTGPGAVIRANWECLRARRRHLGAPPLDIALLAKPMGKLRQLRWSRADNLEEPR